MALLRVLVDVPDARPQIDDPIETAENLASMDIDGRPIIEAEIIEAEWEES